MYVDESGIAVLGTSLPHMFRSGTIGGAVSVSMVTSNQRSLYYYTACAWIGTTTSHEWPAEGSDTVVTEPGSDASNPQRQKVGIKL